MPKKAAEPAITKQYFAQVGSELIEVPADHVGLQAEGASFSTSKPIHFYKVRATLPDGATVEAVGSSFAEAEAEVDKQLPKGVQS